MRTRRPIDAATRAEILARYPHESTGSLAREYGHPASSLYTWAAAAGVHKTWQAGKKRAHRPSRTAERPLGTERLQRGYLFRKVALHGRSDQRWRAVHVLVWEAVHGPVPAGMRVVFKRGRFSAKRDAITLDALECLSNAQNIARNSIHRYPRTVAVVMQLNGKLKASINRSQNP